MGDTEDVTKTNGGRPAGAGKRDEVKVDHETGLLHVPGVGDLPLVGPTSGREYRDLKEAEADFNRRKAQLVRLMRSTWKCTQCKKEWPGTGVRVKKMAPDSDEVVFVCPDPKCDAPVVMTKDALDLVRPPEGAVGQGGEEAE